MSMRLAEVTAVVAAIVCAPNAYPCKTAHLVSNVEMVRDADAIVRATAKDYAPAVRNPDTRQSLEPDSRIRLKINEILRGQVTVDELVLPGVLVDTDDFNDYAPPYNSVRPEGRRGGCFASSYRSAASFS